jgi:hypothetical protein
VDGRISPAMTLQPALLPHGEEGREAARLEHASRSRLAH